jgi:hypothetical protein
MIMRLIGVLFVRSFPRHYTGRHRAPLWFLAARATGFRG